MDENKKLTLPQWTWNRLVFSIYCPCYPQARRGTYRKGQTAESGRNRGSPFFGLANHAGVCP